MIQVGIIGGSGYTGGEVIRILLRHSQTTIDFVYSTTRAGQLVSSTHVDLLSRTKLKFTGSVNPNVDVVFLCLGHGNSTKFLEKHPFSAATKIIDLSNDFRLQENQHLGEKTFAYGLPEFQKQKIRQANAIANPGCFATAIQLALLPLAENNLLQNEVHIHAVTGSTGAGVSPSATTHFSWRHDNVSWYKPFTHQHLGEIGETLKTLQGRDVKIQFLPMRGIFTRGIFATAYTQFEGSLETAKEIFQAYYKEAPFVLLSDQEIQLKQVVNTNNCVLHLLKHEGYLMVTSIIDNLLKGASGQAVQNMNLMFGLEETLGLDLKGSAF
ncbi:MAG: N-acetyl-gamma-glutamyl-phosphate reductase [Flavobacteriaceae bacterium]|nr:N-acetyl-gamma-glutamyl-phosphate reductase [Flavobacteriaceae bacterium]